MSIPLAAIGPAILETIGFNPQGFDYRSNARWPGQGVFGGGIVYQRTGMGEEAVTVRLACRPHVMGGLGQYAVLKQVHQLQQVVPFIRLGMGMTADMLGDVAVRDVSHHEEKIAPDGLGYRHEFEAELLFVGREITGVSL
jgi:phage protein U